MLITENTDLGMKTYLFNKITGEVYKYVKSFNTETNEAEVYVTLRGIVDYELYEKLKEKYFCAPLICKSIYNEMAIFDKEKKRGELLNRHNDNCIELVTAKVTLRNTVAINKETLEEIV